MNADCGHDEYCDASGTCADAGRVVAPIVLRVFGGDGSRRQKVIDAVRVEGAGLGDAEFWLSDGTEQRALVVRSSQRTGAELLLPVTIGSGTYVLTVVNAAGSDEVPFVLELPELPPDEVLSRLNAASGEVALERLPVILATELEVETAVGTAQCPGGYVWDRASTTTIVCSRGRDEMIRVGDFWVDRYEASAWSSPDCRGAQYGMSSDDYPATFPDNGNITAAADRVYACSVRGVLPAAHLTWFQAQQACVASGKRLVTNAEWQAAVAGTFDPGSFDGLAGSKCNTNGVGVRLTGQAGSAPTAGCVSLWGLEDGIGNLWEMTAEWASAGRAWIAEDDAWRSPWPAALGDDGVSSFSGTAWNGQNLVEGLPAMNLRGGCRGYGVSGGVLSIRQYSGLSDDAPCIGFRCARTR